MIQALKHISIRLWATLLISGPLALMLAPHLDLSPGSRWILSFSGILFALVFLLMGFLLNRLGISMANRWLREANTWERAGKIRQAEKAFGKASALFDSFLISPRNRSKKSRELKKRVARFYAARARKNLKSDAFILSYLRSDPGDTAVAENWLSRLQGKMNLSREIHELTVQIGDRHPDNMLIQNHLARIYLAAQRTDFPALSTYKTILKHHGEAATQIIDEVSWLFVSEGRVDDLALTLYLLAWERDKTRTGLAGGLFACIKWLPKTETNRQQREQAREYLKGIPKHDLEALSDGFNMPEKETRPHHRSWIRKLSGFAGPFCVKASKTIWNLALTAVCIPAALAKKAIFFFRGSQNARRILGWSALAGLAACLLMLAAHSSLFQQRKTEAPKIKITTKIKPPALKRYTVQVAAYRKRKHATAYVAKLAEQGLDAYFIEVGSRNKRWFQVRVSHFPDQRAARKFGNQLRKKGIVDDFYVANDDSRE